MATTAVSPPSPSAATPSGAKPPDWHTLGVEDALTAQGVDSSQGLSASEVQSRTQQYGPNAFTTAKKESAAQRFLRQYQDPMQIVLLVAGVICLFLPGQFYTGVFLLLLTVFNAWMAMNQEGKAEASASALSSMMVVKAKVRRNGDLAEVPMDQLVPGEIVLLEQGDNIPADCRLIEAFGSRVVPVQLPPGVKDPADLASLPHGSELFCHAVRQAHFGRERHPAVFGRRHRP